ncbi:PDDEXK nuclease domain-containing protein [Achromobacter piechaudii]|uniref:PDDEXK nuclease domain-containing protein n=1 Tax=Achromobacter piechaudii TaxID=72556 RepID=UPI000B04B0FC|nr:PDDEXK nuclease domain-containing protein [Achromobacter piechaudii]
MAKWNMNESGNRAGLPVQGDAWPALAHELQEAVVGDMESFVMSLDVGFAFVGRQKVIKVDDASHTLDLLLFHRKLRRLVAISVLLDESRPISEDQMEACLRWLDKFERRSHEGTPLGMIVCAAMQAEYIQLLELADTGVQAAPYPTDLPPRAVLAQRLQQASRRARARIAQRSPHDPGTMP